MVLKVTTAQQPIARRRETKVQDPESPHRIRFDRAKSNDLYAVYLEALRKLRVEDSSRVDLLANQQWNEDMIPWGGNGVVKVARIDA